MRRRRLFVWWSSDRKKGIDSYVVVKYKKIWKVFQVPIILAKAKGGSVFHNFPKILPRKKLFSRYLLIVA
jgi:hypothetical protein